ncbi:MAG: purine-nucleoside phosphorylase [Candidatus Eisenbacteria sp.]|nr:purine-nucleoside phosphorylase [Candidatus Eisenbacteria bacterium]
MQEIRLKAEQAAGFLREKGFDGPAVGLILGSGLDALAEKLDVQASVPFSEIPHFPVSTVEHHSGHVLYGSHAGQNLMLMKGRVHYYEGYSMQEVAFPVQVMKSLGAGTLIVTSAVGGLNPLYKDADLVGVVDHINLMGDNPLIGPNDDQLGPRFPDMSEPYDRGLVELAVGAALRHRITLYKGIFVGVAGPNLETRAEYRFLRMIGADIVGMSLVPENLAAVHAGMKVLALCVVTDMCLPDALKVADVQRIIETSARAEPRLNVIIGDVLARLGGPA